VRSGPPSRNIRSRGPRPASRRPHTRVSMAHLGTWPMIGFHEATRRAAMDADSSRACTRRSPFTNFPWEEIRTDGTRACATWPPAAKSNRRCSQPSVITADSLGACARWSPGRVGTRSGHHISHIRGTSGAASPRERVHLTLLCVKRLTFRVARDTWPQCSVSPVRPTRSRRARPASRRMLLQCRGRCQPSGRGVNTTRTIFIR
jgi:hypothetical protein